MGSTQFTDIAFGTTPAEAFNAAAQQARHECGNGGYTGSIAEKDGFKLFPTPEIGADETALTLVMLAYQNHYGEIPDPKRAAWVKSVAPVADDKWGPAAAFEITNTDHGRYLLAGELERMQQTGLFETDRRTGKRKRLDAEPTIKGLRVFVFFGYASC